MNSALEVDVNEDDIITFAEDVPADDLNAEDDLFTFPFDHMYACSSNTIAKPVPRTPKPSETPRPKPPVVQKQPLIDYKSEVNKLLDRLSSIKKENKNFKNIILFDLDLIQQQSLALNNKDKEIADYKKEIAELEAKVARLERKPAYQKSSVKNLLNLPPVPIEKLLSVQASVPLQSPTSTVTKEQADTSKPSIISTNYPNLQAYEESEFITPPNIPNSSPTTIISSSVSLPSASHVTNTPTQVTAFETDAMKLTAKNVPMSRSQMPLTGFQKNGRVASANSYSKSRFLNKPRDVTQVAGEGTIKTTTITTSTTTKKPKMIHTYRSTSPTNMHSTLINRPKYCPASGRFQLIENTTPVGEDPYQLGEADMRENSPIPKLTLQKSHGKLKVTSTEAYKVAEIEKDPIRDPIIGSGDAIRNIKSSMAADKSKAADKVGKYKPTSRDNKIKSGMFGGDWDDYDPKKENNNVETSCRDFSYGDNANNLAANILPHIRNQNFKQFNKKEEGGDYANRESEAKVVNKKRKDRTLSKENSNKTAKIVPEPKKPRKGSLNSAAKGKSVVDDKVSKEIVAKKMPKPLTVKRPYFTQVGNKDLYWYMPIDADFDAEDLDPGCSLGYERSVEVPRWREKPYTSQYSLEGTENLEDSVFNKRHYKQEVDERRRKRWDIQRIREQRHVERLKRRQRDSWYNAASTHNATPTEDETVCSFWPHPHRDAQFIEICDEIPVSAFGEVIPALPKSEFKLPWMRVPKPKKRKKLTLL